MRFCYYVVTFAQESGSVMFEFNESADALEFASTALETGDYGTAITITKMKEDE